MSIYEFAKGGINKLPKTSFAAEEIQERRDLQRLLREQIDVIAPDTLVISEEFGSWVDSRRRIDLLAIDRQANIVVIELKRTEDGGHMDLQSIRYAAMVSTLTFDQAVISFHKFLQEIGRGDEDARSIILQFLGWDIVHDDMFAQSVKIVLASSNFDPEITSTVLWLNAQGLDIVCVRLQPYKFLDRVLVDVQQIIPPPEAIDYQVKINEKNRLERQSIKEGGRDRRKFDINMYAGGRQIVFPNMTKKDSIYNVVRVMCEDGVTPEQISNAIGANVWYEVDGEVDSHDFELRAIGKMSNGGRVFNKIKWYCKDGELFHINGITYAFSNQWGLENWSHAMAGLSKEFEAFQIACSPTGVTTE